MFNLWICVLMCVFVFVWHSNAGSTDQIHSSYSSSSIYFNIWFCDYLVHGFIIIWRWMLHLIWLTAEYYNVSNSIYVFCLFICRHFDNNIHCLHVNESNRDREKEREAERERVSSIEAHMFPINNFPNLRPYYYCSPPLNHLIRLSVAYLPLRYNV